MDSKITSKPIGVIGAGSFGTAIANLLTENCDSVLLYARSKEKSEKIEKEVEEEVKEETMSADWSNFGEVLAKSRMLVKKSASTRGKLRKGELNNNPISEIFGGQFREETMEFGKKTAKVRT